MRGYSKMSDEERQQIAKLHSTPYDGYAIGNVKSNMTPLTVYDPAQDKMGITVNSNGDVKTYRNHNINEIAAKNLHYDEIDDPYEFKSGGPVDTFREEFEDMDDDSDLVPSFDSDGNFIGMVKNNDMGLQSRSMDDNDEINESVRKTLDMFKRFKKYK
jgi:hypothetical protein